MTTSDLATYEQAVAFQTRLVNRAILQRNQVHEIDQIDERANYGSVWVHCTCGHWTSFREDEDERGERLYTAHVAQSLRDSLRTAA